MALRLPAKRGRRDVPGDVPVDLGHAPAGAVRGDHEVADERQLEAAARAHAVDRGDRDRRQVFDHLRRLLVEPNCQ